MRKVRVWLPVGILVALLLWLLAESLLVNLQAGRSVALFSVYRFDPLGTAAFRQYLQGDGINVRLLKHPAMNVKWKGVLIDIQPPRSGGHLLLSATLSKHYHPRLMRWVRQGNTLFEVTYHNTYLTGHEKLIVAPLARPGKKRQTPRHGLKNAAPIIRHQGAKTPATLPSSAPGSKHRKAEPRFKSRKPPSQKHRHHGFKPKQVPAEMRLRRVDKFYFAHRSPKWYNSSLIPARWQAFNPSPAHGSKARIQPPVWLAMPSRFRGWQSGGEPAWHPLLMYQHQALALERRYGKGHIVLLASPWPLLNGGIGSGSNLAFLMSIIGNQPVIFNEWGLGIGGQLTTLELFSQFGLDAFGIQVLVLLVAVLWEARRFSRRQQPSNKAVVASNVQQIAMLGKLYQQSMSDAEIARRVADEVHLRLASSLNVQPAGIGLAVNRLAGGLKEKVSTLLADTQRLNAVTSKGNQGRRANHVWCAGLLTRSAILCQEIKRDRKS